MAYSERGTVGGDRHKFHLDLENFDSDLVPEDCPFVLTSPRSLEACRLLGVRVSGTFF